MTHLLANAEPSDSTISSLTLIIIGVGIVAAVFVLAFIPVAIAWSRRSRRSDTIVLGAVLWGVLAAASFTSATMAQMKWSREKTLRIQSGYYDPNDATDEPQLPWVSWVGLAVLYFVLLAWPLSALRHGPSSPTGIAK
ncbi:MAG TPA: hypothetical protein VN541_17310 [Tepidisphaeraceae bacterium]|nr:hypothetical protein [Tepidisphaeraceae bacterium]